MAVYCTYCGKKFSRKEHLERHIPTHTYVKPYRCHGCQLSFARRDLLHRHQSTYHDVMDDGSPPLNISLASPGPDLLTDRVNSHNNVSQGLEQHAENTTSKTSAVMPVAAVSSDLPSNRPLNQKPISCQHCSKAKAACDRRVPCARCKTRGLDCEARFARRGISNTRDLKVKARMGVTERKSDSNFHVREPVAMSKNEMKHGPTQDTEAQNTVNTERRLSQMPVKGHPIRIIKTESDLATFFLKPQFCDDNTFALVEPITDTTNQHMQQHQKDQFRQDVDDALEWPGLPHSVVAMTMADPAPPIDVSSSSPPMTPAVNTFQQCSQTSQQQLTCNRNYAADVNLEPPQMEDMFTWIQPAAIDMMALDMDVNLAACGLYSSNTQHSYTPISPGICDTTFSSPSAVTSPMVTNFCNTLEFKLEPTTSITSGHLSCGLASLNPDSFPVPIPTNPAVLTTAAGGASCGYYTTGTAPTFGNTDNSSSTAVSSKRSSTSSCTTSGGSTNSSLSPLLSEMSVAAKANMMLAKHFSEQSMSFEPTRSPSQLQYFNNRTHEFQNPTTIAVSPTFQQLEYEYDVQKVGGGRTSSALYD